MLKVQSEVRAGRLGPAHALDYGSRVCCRVSFQIMFCCDAELSGMGTIGFSLSAYKQHPLKQALVDPFGLQPGISHVRRATAAEVAGRMHRQHA